MNNQIAKIKEQYKNCNLLLPVSTDIQVNPFYKMSVMEVKADTSENSGDIFKVGGMYIGDGNNRSWVDVYSPGKPLLMKLAAAAGIQFDPNNTYGTYISKNCYKAKAYGAMRMPDGSGKTHVDEKVINLDDEEDRFRLEFMDKSLQGITDEKQAKEAEKLFKGNWIDSVNKYGKPCKAYVIADIDREKYIDRGILVNMTQLRKTFAEKAMTGAILRVIRALIGMKGTYTLEELKKPFAIPRVTFSPDYNDPIVRREMMAQGMNSVSNMFGVSAPALSPAPQTVNHSEHFETENFNPEYLTENAAFTSDTNYFEDELTYYGEPQEEYTQTQIGQNNEPMCSCCGKALTEKVAQYSVEKFGRPLCMKCQPKGAQ